MQAGNLYGLAQNTVNYSGCLDKSTDDCTNILVVDDDPMIRRLLKRLLSPKWDVDLARNAESCVNLMISKTYYAVITDYEMPGKDGLWLLRYVKKYFPETLRILSSGSDHRHIDNYLESGLVQHSLPKPMDMVRLSRTLKKSPF